MAYLTGNKLSVKSYVMVIVFSEVLISLSAVAMTLSTHLILYNNFTFVSVPLLFFIFFSCLLVYNLSVLNYGKEAKGGTFREQWKVDHQQMLQLILIVSAAGILGSACFLSLDILYFLIHLGVLSILYVLPLKLLGNFLSLRSIPLCKIFVLGYVWTAVTVGLPVLQAGIAFDSNLLLLWVERFLFILALSIPFDIRDFQRDREAGLLTIPGWLGVPKARLLAKALLLLFVLISIFLNTSEHITLARIVCACIAWYLIEETNDKRHDFFYMVGIDGLLIIHFLVLSLSWILQ